MEEVGKSLRDRYLLVDSIRGVASFWILCLHLLPSHLKDYDFIISFIQFGRIGTDFFFVTSGFVTAISCNKILNSRCSFYLHDGYCIKRLKKIYSIYFFSFIFSIYIIPVLMSFVSFFKSKELIFQFHHLTGKEIFLYSSLLKVFSAETWELNKAFVEINGVYWFIAVLVQIHLFIEFALKFKRKFKAIISIVFLISLLSMVPIVKDQIPIGFFLPKFSEFFLGMLLWHMLYESHLYDHKKITILAFSLIPILLSFLIFFHQKNIVGDFYRFISALLLTIFLFLMYTRDHLISETKLGIISRALGRFSYSTYLNHVVFGTFVYMFVRNLVPLPMSFAAPLILVPITLFCCFLFYAFIEYPNGLKEMVTGAMEPWSTVLRAFKSLTRG